MSKSSRRREMSSRDSMARNPNGNREECMEAVRELVSAVASTSNQDVGVRLNGRVNLRSSTQAPEMEVKIDNVIKQLTPTVGSLAPSASGKKDDTVVNATNLMDDKTMNGLQYPLGNGQEAWNTTVVAHGRDVLQPPLAHAMQENEFRNFLDTDTAANPINRSMSINSTSTSFGTRQHIPYHPMEGESLLRRALLTGMSAMAGTSYYCNGVKPYGQAMNFPQQNGVYGNNEEENSDIDVEMVDEGEAIGVYGQINLNDLSGSGGAIVGTGSDRTTRSARNSTVLKRTLSAQSLKKDAKKGFPRVGNSFEIAEKSFAEMSKQQIRAFIQKESKKAKPDFIKLSEAMDITYDTARKAMYDQGLVDVKDIKKKFPGLLHYKMVKEELGRILKDPRKMERLEKELNKEVLSSALEGKKKTLCPGKKRHPIWKKSIQLWEENKGSGISAEYRKILGMLAVCFEFAENSVVTRLCKILKQNEKLSDGEVAKMDMPIIVVRESQIFNVFEEADIWIYLDGQKYIKVPNMYEAVLTVFAVYYIFNIAYDKSLKSLFEFFDYLCDNPQSTYPKTN